MQRLRSEQRVGYIGLSEVGKACARCMARSVTSMHGATDRTEELNRPTLPLPLYYHRATEQCS